MEKFFSFRVDPRELKLYGPHSACRVPYKPYTKAMSHHPKSPCAYVVYTWGFKGFPFSSFRALIYTI